MDSHKKRSLTWILIALLSVSSAVCQTTKKPVHKKYPIGGSAPNGARLKAADLDARLAKWRRTPMPFDSEKLAARDVWMIQKLVTACQYLDAIYWRQSDPDGLTLYKQLESSKIARDQKIVRMLQINGSRWDLLDNSQPFVGDEKMPAGHALYPAGITRDEIEKYVKDHPEEKDAIYNERTVLRRNGSELQAIPYHVAYRAFLEPAARALKEASALARDKAFANFLRMRADALLNDDYYPSDVAWLELQNPRFDIIMAPYETYLDDLLGVRTSYGAAVLIRNDHESRRLDLYEKYVPEMQQALPLTAEDKPSKEGQRMPMEVMDAPFRTGDLGHGYQAVADNLPNDPKIHAEKGTKKIFFKNFMDARVNYVVIPMAQLVMDSVQATKVTAEGYLATTLMHEIAHGLGPAFARGPNKLVDIREAIGASYSGLEEAKADTAGMICLQWMIDHGYIPRTKSDEYYITYVADLFRAMRFGAGEAHSAAETMEFNYLAEQGAIKRDANGRYSVDTGKIPAAVAALAKELLEIEATGDRDRCEKWFSHYGSFPPELTKSLDAAKNVPVDIDPVFSFPRKLQ
ncbi:Zn-dependent hydrolase [Candidatus Koribacter versatilis Ellin345]|uniref:Zn-dependent hydrolase n=1 Tax=Koribacter versatilis (strain Ellin345) TaxID=204669 RepID=Q1IL02_KORVE|nr:hypothetical protein [Candidatus Koribacter versatilis]ABF42448.1 Zn-dependent hydrolase [Candidatus Koribacter versatilis Ellin345]